MMTSQITCNVTRDSALERTSQVVYNRYRSSSAHEIFDVDVTFPRLPQNDIIILIIVIMEFQYCSNDHIRKISNLPEFKLERLKGFIWAAIHKKF